MSNLRSFVFPTILPWLTRFRKPGIILLCFLISISCNLLSHRTYSRTSVVSTMTAQARREDLLSTTAAILSLTQGAIQPQLSTAVIPASHTPTAPLPSESPQPGLLI